MFNKIILAFKFSQSCRSALETSIKLALENDAELLIFHSLDYRLRAMGDHNSELSKVTQEMKKKNLKPK